MLSKLLNVLFPRRCLSCGEYGSERLCVKCQLKRTTPKLFNNNLYYLYKYDGVIRKMLHRLKFMQDKKLVKVFLNPYLEQDIYSKYDIVIPLPCHWLRVLKRKFNHLHFLFDFVPNLDRKIVIRQKYTKKFYKLSRAKREKTIQGVFRVLCPDKIKNKRILIVDDIYTTGSSYNELSKTLLKYEPSCVDGFFICRA